MDKALILERFECSRQAVEDQISSLGNLDEQTRPVEGVWTVKDLAAHLASWEARWHAEFLLPWGDRGTLFDLVDGLRWHDDEHLKAIRRAGDEG